MNESTIQEIYALHDSVVNGIRYVRGIGLNQISETVWLELERHSDTFCIGPILTMSLLANGIAFWGDEVVCQIEISKDDAQSAHFQTGQSGSCDKIVIGFNSGSEITIFLDPTQACIVEKRILPIRLVQ